MGLKLVLMKKFSATFFMNGYLHLQDEAVPAKVVLV